MLHIGSKFRPEHETPYRATNAQVIQAEATNAGLSGRADALPGHSLFDLLVDDVKAGTVRAYTGLDIVLGTMIHPESPKLIKMTLAQMDVDGVLDKTTGGIDVPLYINLTEDQFQNVITQLGFDNINDVSLVKMNVQGKMINQTKWNSLLISLLVEWDGTRPTCNLLGYVLCNLIISPCKPFLPYYLSLLGHKRRLLSKYQLQSQNWPTEKKPTTVH